MSWHRARAVASIDFETCSTVDLTKVGATQYAMSRDTHVWCLAYTIEDQPPRIWLRGDPPPEDLFRHVEAGGLVCAWNANFERQIWRHVMHRRHNWMAMPEDAWSCTMATASYWGLPARLEYCALALRLREQKDPEGHQLMLKMAGPTNLRAREQDPTLAPTWNDNPEHLARLAAYCMQDVVVERTIQRKIAPLPDREREIWLLDQTMNQRGITVDMDLVDQMLPLAAETSLGLHETITRLTEGEVIKTTQNDAILVWLNARLDPKLPNLQKDTLIQRRAVLDPGVEREVIDTRLAGRFASPAKLTALMNATCEDGRLRDLLRYYGAGRTGRWSGAGGSGVQLQNLPRPTIKNTTTAIELIQDDCPADFLDIAFADSALGVIASCLRGCFTASPGHLLTCGDLAQIEARVLAWLAGQHDVLDVFRSGEDIYRFTAEQVGSTNRQLGKVIRLALGFAMGAQRFQATAELYGVRLDIADALAAVETFRAASEAIVQFWWDLDAAFRTALSSTAGGPWCQAGRVAFQRGRTGVAMRLPSQRLLLYRNARLQPHADPQRRDEIVYDGLHQKTRQWGLIRTYGGKLCLASDTLVFTDQGWLPIIEVTPGHRVWDGASWVPHGGVIDQGLAPTIEVDGIGMTPDHRILTREGWTHASSCGGLDRASVALPDGADLRGFRWTEISMARALRLRARYPASRDGVSTRSPKILWLPKMDRYQQEPQNARNESASCLRSVAIHAQPLSVIDTPGMAQLRCERDCSLSRVDDLRPVLGGYGADVSTWADARPHRQQCWLFTDELQVANSGRAGQQHAAHGADRHASRATAVNRGSPAFRDQTQHIGVPSRPRMSRVFDILDAGPNHCFVIAGLDGPVLSHNCENATQAMARDVMADAMLTLDHDLGHRLLLTSHDEIIAEAPEPVARVHLEDMLDVMRQPVPWAPGLPVDATGFTAYRYRKD